MTYIILLISVIPAIISKGYAVSVLWGWFVVETFNVPEMSIPVAMGVCLMFSIQRRGKSEELELDQETFIKILTATLLPFFYLGVGFIYLQFI